MSRHLLFVLALVVLLLSGSCRPPQDDYQSAAAAWQEIQDSVEEIEDCLHSRACYFAELQGTGELVLVMADPHRPDPICGWEWVCEGEP